MPSFHLPKSLLLLCLLLVASIADTLSQNVVSSAAQTDTTGTKARFGVAKTSPDNEDDMRKKTADLEDPENLVTTTLYDDKTNT